MIHISYQCHFVFENSRISSWIKLVLVCVQNMDHVVHIHSSYIFGCSQKSITCHQILPLSFITIIIHALLQCICPSDRVKLCLCGSVHSIFWKIHMKLINCYDTISVKICYHSHYYYYYCCSIIGNFTIESE